MRFVTKLLMGALLSAAFLFGDAALNATTTSAGPAQTQSQGEQIARNGKGKKKGKDKKAKKGKRGKGGKANKK